MSAMSASFRFRAWVVCVLVLMATLALQPSTSRAADPAPRGVVTHEPNVEGWGLWQPANAPHLVLRPHRQPSFEEPHSHGVGTGHRHHRAEHVSGRRTAVPEAATIYRKKVPYSYGYFGARVHRHWSLQHGHQQDRIEWVLR